MSSRKKATADHGFSGARNQVHVVNSNSTSTGKETPPAPFTAQEIFRNCPRQSHGMAGNSEAVGFVNSAVNLPVLGVQNENVKYPEESILTCQQLNFKSLQKSFKAISIKDKHS